MLLQSARAICLLSLLSPIDVRGLTSDMRLVQLVPPDSQIIAGMDSRSRNDHLDSFLLITRGNKIDLQDFFAIVGADASREIREVIFVAETGETGVLNEHSLLAKGHFNRDAIYRMADNGSATRSTYRGVPVLVVPPLSREAGKLDQLRWLTVVEEGTAVFGTLGSVRRELDRWFANAPADATLRARLNQLGPDDQSWCVLTAGPSAKVAENALAKLDPNLATLLNRGPVAYGIHFGKRIEVTVSFGPISQSALEVQRGHSPSDANLAADLLSRSDAADGTRAVVNVSRSKYAKWITGYANGVTMNE